MEFLACLRRWETKGRIQRDDTLRYLRNFVLPLAVVTPTTQVLTTSLDLAAQHSLSHWDSLLLAACNEAGVTTLYSEDLSHGQTYGSVTVVNPFQATSGK